MFEPSSPLYETAPRAAQRAPELREVKGRAGEAREAMRSLDRRAGLPLLHGAPHGVSDAFGQASLAVLGTGSVGSHIADAAARLAPRRLLLVDRGRFKARSNLTHPCHPDDLGRAKAWDAAERAKAISPATRVFVFEGAFEALPGAALAGIDYALLASDNLRAELTAGAYALEYDFDLIEKKLTPWTELDSVATFLPVIDALTNHFQAEQLRGQTAAEWRVLDVSFPCVGVEPRAAASGFAVDLGGASSPSPLPDGRGSMLRAQRRAPARTADNRP